MTDFVVLIPAYNPDERLSVLVRALVERQCVVVIVDDGSVEASAPVFEQVSSLPHVTVLRHVVNLGKGAALKTAMNYIAVHYGDKNGIVSADADGQHAVEDILKIGAALSSTPNALILGARSFRSDIPFRSRFGNVLTRRIFNFLTGLNLTDTQTGLRGVPMEFVPKYLGVRPNGYEFELEQLIRSKRYHHPIVQVPIVSIYIDDNEHSHFNPFLDSARIYFVFIRFISSSLMAAILDYLMFMLVYSITHNILASQYIARGVSGTFNYTMNRRRVFYSRTSIWSSLPKYIVLAVLLAFCSYVLISGLVEMDMPVAMAKPLAEAILFVISFGLQRSLVFERISEVTEYDE